MSSWIRSDIRFQDRLALFTVEARDRSVFNVLGAIGNGNIDAVESALLSEIERCRPDLKGCVLLSVSFNPCRVAWEMVVSHSSLPKRNQGDFLPHTPLTPPAWPPAWLAETKTIADIPLMVK